MGHFRTVAASPQGGFVAAGANAFVTTSPDGITWTNGPSIGTGFLTLEWYQGRYVGQPNAYTSSDGVTWTKDTTGALERFPNNWQAWNGTTFVSVTPGPAIVSSTLIPPLTTAIAGMGSRPRRTALDIRLTSSGLHLVVPDGANVSRSRVTVYAASGRKVKEVLVDQDGTALVPVSDLPRGVYVVEYRSAKVRLAQRVTLAR